MYSSNIILLYFSLINLYTVCGFDKLLPRFLLYANTLLTCSVGLLLL